MTSFLKLTGLFLAALPLFLLAGAYPAQAAAASGEEAVAALAQIQAAVDRADGAAFEERVDLDAILDNGLDVFLNEAAPNIGLPPMLALMLSGVGSQPAVRRLLLDETRAFVLNNINNGSFGGGRGSGASGQGRFAPLFSGASTGRKEVVEIGEPAPDNGGWLLPFMVLDHGNGNFYKIDGWFCQENGRMRLKAIRNLNELFGIISREAGG